jgi:hypothetical protein
MVQNNIMKMETTKIFTGTLIASAILNAASIKASNSKLFGYTLLGTGSEVRTVLLDGYVSAVKFSDLCCGKEFKKEMKMMRKSRRKDQRKAMMAGFTKVKRDKKIKDSAPASETNKI